MKHLVEWIRGELPELTAMRETQLRNAGPQGWVTDWEIRDYQADLLLISFSYRSGGPWSVDWNPQSCVAVVSLMADRPQLMYIESLGYYLIFGLLHPSTGHAVLVRYREYDDTVYDRYGHDEVAVVDLRSQSLNTLSTYHFGIGSYLAGAVRVDINSARNWIVIAREERAGWQSTAHIVAQIYDLVDGEQIVSAPLEGVRSLNSVSLPGAGSFLIVTDQGRTDHAFQLSENRFSPVHSAPELSRWKVAISFAGKDRVVAEQIAMGLKRNGVTVFYDEFEKSELLGKDLIQALFEIYSKRSEYCVILISENYKHGRWPMHELKAIQAGAFNAEKEFLLPVRLDDSELPGLPPQIGYLDLRRESPDSVVQIIVDKVKKYYATHNTAAPTDQKASLPGR